LQPLWAQVEGTEEVLRRLTDPLKRRQIVEEVVRAAVDWASVILSGLATPANQALIGRSLDEVARARAVAALEAVCQLLIEERLEPSFIYHHGNEGDVCRIMRSPFHTIGSDGIQTGQRPHPGSTDPSPGIWGVISGIRGYCA
jgi:N-acyl-D-amino-acid deacylase